MIPGLIVGLGALAVATALGFGWRSRNGQVRAVRPSAGHDDAALVAGAVGTARWAAAAGSAAAESAAAAGPGAAAGSAAAESAAAAGPGAAAGSAAAGSAAAAVRSASRSAGPGVGLTEADLGTALGSRATLLQFSSAFCAPCRATRVILAEVAAVTDGVTHIEIDAGSRLDLVRRLDVRRTPTTFVLGPRGDVTHRASGQPRKADVMSALGVVI